VRATLDTFIALGTGANERRFINRERWSYPISFTQCQFFRHHGGGNFGGFGRTEPK
jgi:hypothetical protein